MIFSNNVLHQIEPFNLYLSEGNVCPFVCVLQPLTSVWGSAGLQAVTVSPRIKRSPRLPPFPPNPPGIGGSIGRGGQGLLSHLSLAWRCVYAVNVYIVFALQG